MRDRKCLGRGRGLFLFYHFSFLFLWDPCHQGSHDRFILLLHILMFGSGIYITLHFLEYRRLRFTCSEIYTGDRVREARDKLCLKFPFEFDDQHF